MSDPPLPAEAGLFDEDGLARALLEASPHCVKVLDRQGRLLYVSDHGRCLLEVGDATELLGRTWAELWPEETRSLVAAAVERAGAGEPVSFEAACPTARGVERRWEVSVAPVRRADGAIVHLLAISQDVTARRLAEDGLREAARRKDEFLATLAHELRNPMAAIRTALHVLQVQQPVPADAPSASALGVLERQSTQMVRLIDDLLDVSRLGRGKIELQLERVELNAIVEQAVEAVRGDCAHHELDLALELPSHPVYVRGDATRLAQVVGNLLANACKFTDPAGTIHVALAARDGQAVLQVRDTGIGIASDQLGRIFELFAQVGERRQPQAGLGIGLSLVKRLVELHGGTVEVSSDGPGRGSSFSVRLPLEVAPSGEGPPARAGEAGSSARGSGPKAGDTRPPQPAAGPECANTGPRRRVLVVDDNVDSASTLCALLRLQGHDVHTVHAGLAAVEVALALRPDVVLLDIGLPDIDGYEAARRIRAAHDNGATPLLVALTGWGQDEDRRRSADAGFDAHLVKPADVAALAELLRRAPGAPAGG